MVCVSEVFTEDDLGVETQPFITKTVVNGVIKIMTVENMYAGPRSVAYMVWVFRDMCSVADHINSPDDDYKLNRNRE